MTITSGGCERGRWVPVMVRLACAQLVYGTGLICAFVSAGAHPGRQISLRSTHGNVQAQDRRVKASIGSKEEESKLHLVRGQFGSQS